MWKDQGVEKVVNLSFTRRNVVNFSVKNLEFFRIDIYFEIYCFILGVIVKMLFSMVCCCPQHAESLREKFGPGVVVFIRIRRRSE